MADPRAVYQKAEKALAGASGGFSFFGGGKTEKLENAAELFIEAANAYKMTRDGKTAGHCFEQAADIQKNRLQEGSEAATSLQEGYKAYKSAGCHEDAARCLEEAIAFYTGKGHNLRRAATSQEKLAELYEVELQDQKRAVVAYENAAQWLEDDGATAQARKLWVKLADIAALDADYPKAIQNYERVAKSCIGNDLMRYSVREYYLKAGVCHLAIGDMVGFNRAMDTYREDDPTWPAQREHQLLGDLAEAYDEADAEKYADKLFQYDQMSKLNKWQTTMFLRIKDAIDNKGEDFS